MNMHFVDWCIVLGMLGFVVAFALYSKRYTRSVADFLAANRCGGRYMVCVADGIAGICAISIVAWFEMYYAAGFTAAWWELLINLALIVLALTGWVVYRFRETRAMTLAQFFEARYSKRFRIFAGIILWSSGIVNFGIFPAVGARFFIHFCGFPETVPILGIPTFIAMMLFLLGISIMFVFLGGQITVMITDFIQGMFVNVVMLIILAYIFWRFDWVDLIGVLKQAPADASRLNPYHTAQVDGFNPWYFLIQIITLVYGCRAWQGNQAYYCSAKSPHEAKMASILAQWRVLVLMLVILLLPITVYVAMHSPAYTEVQTAVQNDLQKIDNPAIKTQMTVPIALAHLLPPGIFGLLAAVMLAAFITTHDTYLHSWGSIFVQDVILPFRKKPFTPKQHMLLLKASIFFVAIFVFFWSLLFQQTEYIRMFFAITGAIWLGGAGAVIAGGLYWKRGSTLGAFIGVTTGAVIAVGGIVAGQLWKGHLYPWMTSHTPDFLAELTRVINWISGHISGIHWEVTPDKFPIDGQWVNMFAIASAIFAYMLGSFISWKVFKKPAYNLNRLLYRGEYSLAEKTAEFEAEPVSGWRVVLPSPEFSIADKGIFYANIVWTLMWLAIFVIATIWNLTSDVSDDAWATFWWINTLLTVVIGTSTTIWFFIGGIFDMRDLFRTLSSLNRDHQDNGRVEDGQNTRTAAMSDEENVS